MDHVIDGRWGLMNLGLADIFIMLLVTIGPLKATLVYATDAALPSKSIEVVVSG